MNKTFDILFTLFGLSHKYNEHNKKFHFYVELYTLTKLKQLIYHPTGNDSVGQKCPSKSNSARMCLGAWGIVALTISTCEKIVTTIRAQILILLPVHTDRSNENGTLTK